MSDSLKEGIAFLQEYLGRTVDPYRINEREYEQLIEEAERRREFRVNDIAAGIAKCFNEDG